MADILIICRKKKKSGKSIGAPINTIPFVKHTYLNEVNYVLTQELATIHKVMVKTDP